MLWNIKELLILYIKMSIQVKFDNESVVKKAIDDVHNDQSDITWCCVTHLNDDPNILTLQSTGKGGVEVRIEKKKKKKKKKKK